MKAKTKFMRMYHKLPEQARTKLVLCPYDMQPMTLAVCALEVKHDTKTGKEILAKMGYIKKRTRSEKWE